MSALLQRLSFIGKRPVNYYKSEISVAIKPYENGNDLVRFGKLPFKNTIKVSGKMGSYDVNLVDGLTCQISEGSSLLESTLTIDIDIGKYQKFNKYQRSFLKSMHGTTNSILMRYIEGVAEV